MVYVLSAYGFTLLGGSSEGLGGSREEACAVPAGTTRSHGLVASLKKVHIYKTTHAICLSIDDDSPKNNRSDVLRDRGVL